MSDLLDERYITFLHIFYTLVALLVKILGGVMAPNPYCHCDLVVETAAFPNINGSEPSSLTPMTSSAFKHLAGLHSVLLRVAQSLPTSA